MEKTKVICDTDVIIDYLDRKQSRHHTAKQLLDNTIGLAFVTLSAITKMELIVGVQNKVDLAKLYKNINVFNILLINPGITSIAISLLEKYKLSYNLAMPFALIAATAIHTDFELFTFNIRDFKFINDLKLFEVA